MWSRAVRSLAAGIASLVNVLDPEVVVLGGGIALAGDTLFVPLRREMTDAEWRPLGEAVPIVPARLGDFAGAIGAARHAMTMDAPSAPGSGAGRQRRAWRTASELVTPSPRRPRRRQQASGANGKHHSRSELGPPQTARARGLRGRRRRSAGSSVTSTIRSSAIASMLAWSSSSAAPRGSRNRARARNNVSPVIGALVHSVSSSSTLTPLAANACDTSRTIPGRSVPTSSSASSRPAGTLDLAAALDQDGESLIGLERAQRALELGGRVLVHLDAQDAGELTGETRHAALQPVAAVAGDQRRHRLDQAGAVRSEQGEHQGSSHASLSAKDRF